MRPIRTIDTPAHCAKCNALTNRHYLVNGVCEWCRQKTVNDLRASLHADAKTHIGGMFKAKVFQPEKRG